MSDSPLAEKSDRQSCWWAWLMGLLAVGALEIAATDGEQPLQVALFLGAVSAVVFVANWIAQAWLADRILPRRRTMAIFILASGMLSAELAIRQATQSMWPFELLLLAGLRNVILAVAVFAHQPDAQRQHCILSTFLIIFASTVASLLWLQGLVVVFAVIGIWWLMGSYWETINERLVASASRDLPRRWLLLLPLMLAASLLAIPLGARPLRAVAGFMPSSGGTEWYAENARSGIGDGDALVAGTEDIRSFAPIEDAPFLSSHDPSLYDLFDDSYDEPVRNSKQDRAIALQRELVSQQKEHHLANSQQAGRQFSTLRQLQEQRKGKIKDRPSDALFYVQGRTPLHLKLQVYDAYDGVDWHEEPLEGNEPPLQIEQRFGRPWLRILPSPGPEVYGPPESHALKIVHLATNRLPSPTELLGIHIDQLDRADFFAWAQPGLVKMDRETLPAQTVIHLQSRTVNRQKLQTEIMALGGRAARYQQFGEDFHSRQVRELARKWTAEVPRGWPQINAIADRLRKEYVVDPDARPPEDCRNTVAWFLLESKRGPDYQFASAAVWMLRSLGYSTRLASGFYARPENYELRSRHTPVHANDVHFWAEVYAGGNHWIPLEPTPGYEYLEPPLTWTQQLQAALITLLHFVLENLLLIVVSTIVLATIFSHRRFLADAIATQLWRWHRPASPRQLIRSTGTLLDARLKRVGLGRPAGITLSRWLRQLSENHLQTQSQAARELAKLMDWAEYAPASAPCEFPANQELCQQVERDWNWALLRRCQGSTVKP